MKIGRNDPCFCGSGKKYKKCCLNGNENWRKGIEDFECEQDVKDIILSAFDFIIDNDFQGGCHLISTIMYILLSERGYQFSLKTGEVQVDNYKFDHSWLEVAGLVIDITSINTLQDNKKFAPVIFGESVVTGMKSDYKYGVTPNLDMEAKMVLSQSLSEYIMAGISHGSLKIMQLIADNAGFNLENVEEIVMKYSDTYRELAVAR